MSVSDLKGYVGIPSAFYLYKEVWTSITLLHKSTENSPYLGMFRLLWIHTSELFHICLIEQFLWRKTDRMSLHRLDIGV